MNDEAPTGAGRLDRMFSVQASKTPLAPAIYFRGQALSYGELIGAVEALSDKLVQLGVGPGILVAIAVGRSPPMVGLVLAVLQAGAAYLPLDHRYPADRMQFVLDDSGAAVLVIDRGQPAPASFEGTILELSVDGLFERERREVAGATLPSELAYLIYTSGSSGRPKGVMLGHGATCLVEWARAAYSPLERSLIAATTSLSFDPSIFEIFVPLCTGGALILKQDALDPFEAGERPTMLNSVPSVLAELCRAEAIPKSVQVLNVGGEALRSDLARVVFRLRPEVGLYNHYGPTEATTCATVARIDLDVVDDPPVGRPVRGATISLLGEDGLPVGEGQVGEIHIGGPGLALGYLNQPELTAARFKCAGKERVYRTGDLGFWRDGQLHFSGRVDQQVKIRGFRVEQGEVEVALRRIPGVEDVAVATREIAGAWQLSAWVQSQADITESTIRQELARWLPDYMRPTHIAVTRALPRQVSGKVDHAILPTFEEPQPADFASAAPPAERPILHVFEEVLARKGIGSDDSFFDLGGDSLSSLRAALRLEEVLGREIPAALIHQAPSARMLARALTDEMFLPDTHLSVLQDGEGEPAIFCMADLFGHAFNYLSLAGRLGPDRTVYGVGPGPLQDAFSRDANLQALADAYVAAIRAKQHKEPYILAGYSSGGALAVAVAGRLEAEGQAVRLILLDSYLHSRRPSLRWMSRWLYDHGRPSGASAERVGQGIKLITTLVRVMVKASPRPPDWVPPSQLRYAVSMIRAGMAFRPSPIFASTLIVRASKPDPTDILFAEDGSLGWGSVLRGDVVQVTVSGDHHEFLREPSVTETASVVTRFLSRNAW